MRIAAITNSRIPSLTANSIQAMKACEALTQMGHEVKIFAPREVRVRALADLCEHYGLESTPDVEWHASLRPLRRLDFVLRALRATEKFKADMIYTWLPQAAVLGLWRGHPVVLEMHANVGGRLGAWWLRAFWRARGLKRMTVTTQALRSALERSAGHKFPLEAVIAAPNGVDLPRYRGLPDAPEARRRLGLAERQTVGFTGHVYPGRGAELLLELARRMPETGFLWVGGTAEAVAFWRIELHQREVQNVMLTGFVNNSRVPLYQAAADILVMPYGRSVQASSGQDIAEVINPMKMFEYMAAGRAIVSADLSVIHEVLNEHNAVFCAPGNADDWEAVLRRLLADGPRRRALGATARADAEAFTWPARARRILNGFVEAP
jgi:glycosyltransferase involved in cell wall biosynthesis